MAVVRKCYTGVNYVYHNKIFNTIEDYYSEHTFINIVHYVTVGMESRLSLTMLYGKSERKKLKKF